MDNINFEDIRPYSDQEMPEILKALYSEPEFNTLVKTYFPIVDLDKVAGAAHTFSTVTMFQNAVIRPILEALVGRLATSLTASGLEHISSSPAIYMSNHRDIVMDPTLLQLIMLRHDKTTTEIAIGDNLLSKKWIRDMVRLNKSFIVKRNLSAREMAKSFMTLSSYIRYAITEKQSSVWIAQREGRAKDSDDRTQESLIKMFALSGDNSFIENIRSLNIIPVAISYEYDPCDYLKALEYWHKHKDANYKKDANEDLVSMQTGISGFKGRIHYTFTEPLNHHLESIIATAKNNKEQAAAICSQCDKQIHSAYVIYPINRVAYTLLTGDKHFMMADREQDRKKAEEYLRSKLDKITEAEADRDFLWQRLLEMYANPLINHIKAK